MKSGRGILQDLTIVIEDLVTYHDNAAALSRLRELASAIRRRGIAEMRVTPPPVEARCVCCGKPLCYACQ